MIFDYGGVISLPQEPSFIRMLADMVGADADALARAYRSHRHDYDRGVLTGAGYWRSVLEAGGAETAERSAEELIRLDVQSWIRINPDTLDLLSRLDSAGVVLALLSNLPSDHLTDFQERFRWLELFAVRVYSCELGRAKPDPEIYRQCLARLDRKAEKCLFVDDTEANVTAARELGMHALEFAGAGELERELRERLDGITF